jgi:excisionase family DNA binding protein
MDKHQLDLAELYTTAEAARLLRVSKSTIYRWLATDPPTLGYFQMPTGTVRIAGAHLERFLEEHGSDLEQEPLFESGWDGDEELQ